VADGDPENWRRLVDKLGVAVVHFPRYVNRTLRLHGTPCVLASCAVAGGGIHHLGDRAVPERGASVSVVHYGELHDIVTEPTGIEVYNLFLDPQRHPLPRLPTPLDAVLGELIPLHPAFRNQVNQMVRLEFDDFTPIRNVLSAMHAEQRHRPPGWRGSMRNLLERFLICCCRRATPSPAPPPSGDTALIEAVRRHCDRHFAERLGLTDLAREAGWSPNHLCRRFKAYTGRSPMAYRDDRRIQAAMRALQGGDERILDVALAVGFDDVSRFNKVFKRRVGKTPGAYRRQWR